MSKVLVPFAKGFEEIEGVTIVDVLRRADVEVVVASLSDELLVEGANGICLKATCSLKDVDVDTLDMVVLPGGWDGTHALADDELMQNILKEMDRKNKLIGAICAAPFALNKAGVLKQNYTCYPSVEGEIREDGYNSESMVVEDTNILTSRGPATAMCFALEIVKKLKGQESYEALKNGLLATFC